MNVDSLKIIIEETKSLYKEELLSTYSEKKLIEDEKRWIDNYLSIFYLRKDILDVELQVNPYLKIESYSFMQFEEENRTSILFIPKYIALADLLIYSKDLQGESSLIESLKEYGEPFKGKELLDILFEDDVKLEKRIDYTSCIIRSYLSTQYLVCEQ